MGDSTKNVDKVLTQAPLQNRTKSLGYPTTSMDNLAQAFANEQVLPQTPLKNQDMVLGKGDAGSPSGSAATQTSVLSDTALQEGVRQEVLPGGVPDQGHDQDKALIHYLAVLLVDQSGIIKQKGEVGYLTAIKQVEGVLQSIAQFFYDSGYQSVGEGFRRFLGVDLASETLGEFLTKLQEKLHIPKVENYLTAIQAALLLHGDQLNFFQSGDTDDEQGDTAALAAAAITIPAGITQAVSQALEEINSTGASKNTGTDGRLAHACIQIHYLLSHREDIVLIDAYVVGDNQGLETPSWLTLGAAEGSNDLDLLRQGLKGASPGIFKQPDILNLTTREIYEIKPATQALRGLLQLYGRYLLPLNIILFGVKVATAILTGQTLEGGTSVITDLKPFLPGYNWYPAFFYVLPPARLMVVVRPVPGLILYEIFDVETEPEGFVWYEDLVSMYFGMIIVAVAVLAPEFAAGGAAVGAVGEALAAAGGPVALGQLMQAFQGLIEAFQ